mmetsp:Transcript_11342/g.24429  ORF Transcript_11342/g.24429 Transcript_11342/m.24429 type:complete len:637 (-) Transcript_11342:94-2004(-)
MAMAQKSNMPFLPGCVAHDITKTRHHKTQTLVYKLDSAADNMKPEPVQIDRSLLHTMATKPAFRLGERPAGLTHDEREMAREAARNTYRPHVQPSWLKHDRQVLHFMGYFQEPVHENPNENARIRYVDIYYYLEDGTMQVNEPKVENSGIPQGAFVKRHRIPKADGEFYGPNDLRVGSEVTIYSRTFRLHDCDDFTRWFFQEAGLGEQAQEEAPVDNFVKVEQFKKELLAMPVPKEVMDTKEYTELKLGGQRKNAKLEQYLENDRRVLRFFAYWDDETRYGTRLFFTVHFFLSDDTVEILDRHTRNAGRDPYPVFYRRSALAKTPQRTHVPGMIVPDMVIYKPEDLKVGDTLVVYGRKFFIYDCDDFTRKFYREYSGVEQPALNLPTHEQTHIQLTYPPHTGFGSEEDSLASCLALRPKPPRQDLVKLMSNSDRILRFEARMDNHLPEDASRTFIIGCFLADDSVGVWEVKQRNSGQVEGKWAERSRKINPATGTWYTPQDFFVGTTCTLNSMPFYLRRADEYTLKYMETRSFEFPLSDINLIAKRIRPWVETEMMQQLAARGTKVTPQEMQQGIAEALNLDVTDQEVITILRNLYDQCVDESEGEVLIDLGRLQQVLQSGDKIATGEGVGFAMTE